TMHCAAIAHANFYAAPLSMPPQTSASTPRFFFQAEDGIRDGHVTGVQTCALPIYTRADLIGNLVVHTGNIRQYFDTSAFQAPAEIGRASCRKECRSRWSPYH